ncbi:class I SAM-dependent methyltransferase [Streptomyces sp. CAU 1734]|uniref:class I SAM-dependent methyltransferase n=1 Tax=Streptomyces sp. CAU 1734 TaxID=3140360 RepID=UPI0032619635
MTHRNTPAAEVFDSLGAEYERAFAHAPGHHEALRWLAERLPPGSEVLDVGSGTGYPTAHALAGAGHRVLGVDVSPVMVELAARRVPEAVFRRADARTLEIAPASLDAVCAFFSLLQMDRADQRALVERIAGWLRPGGLFVTATAVLDVERAPFTWMGHDVEVTSFAAGDYLGLLEAAGLTVLESHEREFTPDVESPITESQLFAYARKP